MINPVESSCRYASPRILVTNNGAHSPEDLALLTAEMIAQYGDTAEEDAKLEVMRFRLNLAEALTKQHEANQLAERQRLQTNSEQTTDFTDAALKNVLDQASATRFYSHYIKPEVQAVVKQVLTDCFDMSRRIEQDWHNKRQRI